MITIKHLETKAEIHGKALVHCQAWKEAYAGLIDQSFLDSRTVETSQQFAVQAFKKGIPTFVAMEDGRIIGFIDYGPYRSGEQTDIGEIYALYILKEFYGKGIGYTLIKKALEELKEYRQVAVWVLEENERAIRFYTQCGFCLDGQKQTLSLGTPVTEAKMILNR